MRTLKKQIRKRKSDSDIRKTEISCRVFDCSHNLVNQTKEAIIGCNLKKITLSETGYCYNKRVENDRR